MIDEENKLLNGSESQNTNEFIPSKESYPQSENIFDQENLKQEEFSSNVEVKSNAKKKKNLTTTVGGGLVVVVGAVMLGVTNLVNVTFNAQFIDEQMVYRDGALYYAVNVENMTDKENLTIHWYENRKEISTFELLDEDGDGIVEGKIDFANQNIQSRLEENPDLRITYSFTLKGMVGLNVDRKFDNYDLEIGYSEVTVRDIYRECNCGTTGYYNFQIDYDDPFGSFYDFAAYIITDNQERSDCVWKDNKHDVQEIYVLDLHSMTGTLVIDWKSGIQSQPNYHYEYDVHF